jgi:hypothetical protein
MDGIKVDIHLTLASETVELICNMNKCSRAELIQAITTAMNENIGDTIMDNDELWASQIFEIE